MSVKIMAQVWDLDNEKIAREEKYILLAYADHADHEGNNMFPSIATICKKTGYKERAVQIITRSLEAKGYLIPSGHGKSGTNKWSFGWGAENAGVQNTTLGGAERKGKGVHPTAPEPLTIIKPSKSDVFGFMEMSENLKIKQSGNEVEEILVKLELGLRVNIARSTNNQAVAKRILKDGRPLETWLGWVTSDEWRTAHLYIYADLEKVWRDFPQAFDTKISMNPQGLEIGL
jgi:hypothetical protein